MTVRCQKNLFKDVQNIGVPVDVPTTGERMKKLLRIIPIMVIVLIAVVGQRWYSYVTNTTDPFDEVGISLQSYMPAPLRHWGCMQLKKNFDGKTLPPYGCQAASGTGWVE